MWWPLQSDAPPTKSFQHCLSVGRIRTSRELGSVVVAVTEPLTHQTTDGRDIRGSPPLAIPDMPAIEVPGVKDYAVQLLSDTLSQVVVIEDVLSHGDHDPGGRGRTAL